MNSEVLKYPAEPEIDISQARKSLIDLAVNGLEQMFDTEKQLFCFRVRQNHHELYKEKFSRRYTIISLLGLHQLEKSGSKSPINVQIALQALLQESSTIDNIGDIGLLLWLCALTSPSNIDQIYSELNIRQALDYYSDARLGFTTELAWFLTGLSHTKLSVDDYPDYVSELASSTYKLIKENFGGKGIFRHQNTISIAGKLRGRIGSFADQVYPIYAFTRYAQAFEIKEALKIALDCAKTICRHQGPLGQWWWHYDSITGEVIGWYPVYSTHQDGMAPMALNTVGKLAGYDFDQPITKGLKWLFGNNEVGIDLTDNSRHVIWRSFVRNRYKMYKERLLSLTKFSKREANSSDITINFECRPYHLGWILYAFAN